MPRVVHFEIHADDPERAIKFYGDVFGWTFNKWEGPMEYWLITTGPKEEMGIDGGLARRMAPRPEGDGVTSYFCTIGVFSASEYEEKIKAHGGAITMSKSPIPGVGWFVGAKDTEGNMFSVMETDMSAK